MKSDKIKYNCLDRKIVESEYGQVRIGGYYKHFKGNVYKVLYVGINSETEEPMVVYQEASRNDADFPCIRPLQMFLSEVDHEKYPDVNQKYRFELCDRPAYLSYL